MYLEDVRHAKDMTRLMELACEERDKLENSYLGSLEEISYLQDKVTRLQEENKMYEDFLRAIKVEPIQARHYAETGELP